MPDIYWDEFSKHKLMYGGNHVGSLYEVTGLDERPWKITLFLHFDPDNQFSHFETIDLLVPDKETGQQQLIEAIEYYYGGKYVEHS